MNKEVKKLALSEVKGIVPPLRFPEFENDGEWEIKKLSKLGHLINGLTYSPKDIRDEGLLVLRSSNVQDGKIVLEDNVFVRPDIKGANISKPNDILICVRNGSKALIGKNAILPENLPYSTHGAFMTMFRAKNPKFTFQLFQTEGYDRQVKADLGATINSINGKNFIKYEFAIPPNPKEQQKIAACLSSLDEVITAETEKLDILQDHKKGLLQQLFPVEGESQPKYRFPEFKEDGDWEERELKKLLKFQTGYPFSSKGFNDENKGIRLIKNRDLKADDRIVFFEGSFDNSYLVDDGDILVGMDGDFSPVKWKKGKALLNQRVGRIKTKNNTDDFFFYFLSIHLKIIEYNTPSTTVKHLSHSTVEKLLIPIPPTKEEQQKIAACLSAADDLLEAQTQKIEALQEHKKGLLQQLFPTLSEL